MQSLPITSNPRISVRKQTDKISEAPVENTSIARSNSYDYVVSSSTESLCVLDPPNKPEKESFYWHPSNEEMELMNELRELKLKIFDKTELEYVVGLCQGVKQLIWVPEMW